MSLSALLLLCQREGQVALGPGGGEGGRGREDELLRLRVVALRRQADTKCRPPHKGENL